MKKIVTLGGGTGSFAVLKGLKEFPYDITAIATMFDSGGSSGVLIDEHGVLPPGDVRRCLVALSEGWREETMRQLFNYRFENGKSLKGHSFGNILITALTDILGDEAQAIEQAGYLLNIRGKVLPVSLEKSQLCARLSDDSIIEGESNIDIREHDTSLAIEEVFLKPPVSAYQKVFEALEDADVIVMGPGDLYTSLIPNLLVDGVKEALQQSKAKKVYIVNLFTKAGETDGYVASTFAHKVLEYSGLDHFDALIYNNEPFTNEVVAAYQEKNQSPVQIDNDVFSTAHAHHGANLYSGDDFARHDPRKLAEAIHSLLQ